ncbi:hypothetical protein BVX99_01880 [bacterium F16]|nr:hypothetical protein BVX99_01880 [bacterium F16]
MQRHISIWKLFVAMTTLFCIANSQVSAKDSKTVKVFLLAGQSNMAGKGKIRELKPPYSEPLQKIMMWNWKGQAWSALTPGIGNRRGQVGPEISFGHAIAKAFPGEDVRLIKFAIDGTSLYDDWSPKEKKKPYTGFMSIAKKALGNLDAAKVNYEIAGMLWLQGESDAHENKAGDYGTNLTEFIAHMRTNFKTSDMPFIIARVRSYYGGKTGQAKIVRDTQVKIAESDKNAGWFDTDDLPLSKGHYTTVGLIEVGKRFAATFQKVAEKANGHHPKKRKR